MMQLIFLYFKIIVKISNENAAIQNGTATSVKKSKGMPAAAKPRNVRRDIKATGTMANLVSAKKT